MESYVDLLPSMDPWEWQLLFDVELFCEEQELWEALTTQICTIATDGSAQDGKGSFAWVISNGNGDTIAECKGPVMGAKVTSYRAEGYGADLVLGTHILPVPSCTRSNIQPPAGPFPATSSR